MAWHTLAHYLLFVLVLIGSAVLKEDVPNSPFANLTSCSSFVHSKVVCTFYSGLKIQYSSLVCTNRMHKSKSFDDDGNLHITYVSPSICCTLSSCYIFLVNILTLIMLVIFSLYANVFYLFILVASAVLCISL